MNNFMENQKMTEQEIKDTLASGLCKFTFTKKDGTIREAYGTRNQTVVSENNAIPNGRGSDKEGTIPYYDVETNGWRSFKTESFIEFLNVMKHQPNIEVTIY